MWHANDAMEAWCCGLLVVRANCKEYGFGWLSLGMWLAALGVTDTAHAIAQASACRIFLPVNEVARKEQTINRFAAPCTKLADLPD